MVVVVLIIWPIYIVVEKLTYIWPVCAICSTQFLLSVSVIQPYGPLPRATATKGPLSLLYGISVFWSLREPSRGYWAIFFLLLIHQCTAKLARNIIYQIPIFEWELQSKVSFWEASWPVTSNFLLCSVCRKAYALRSGWKFFIQCLNKCLLRELVNESFDRLVCKLRK